MCSTENLITSVYKRPAIWDPRHYLHKNRNAVQILWEEIAAEVGLDSATLKHKWKILRDFHRTELKRMRGLRKTLEPDEPQPYFPAWQFFPMMSFLNDMASSRSRCRHLPPLESSGSMTAALRDVGVHHESHDRMLQTNEDSELLQNDDQDGEDMAEVKMKDDGGGKKLTQMEEAEEGREMADENSYGLLNIWDKYDRRKLLKSECMEKFMEMEKRKLLQLEKEKEDEDEDLMFFKSFLPDLKTLPRVRKLYLKLKFQELLYNEISNGDADGANTEATGSIDKSI